MYPLVGRLDRNRRTLGLVRISIHAPLAGCDLWLNFGLCINCLFQSTHPLRGATVQTVCAKAIDAISIHAPLAGCDGSSGGRPPDRRDFNPRTPCGVRLDRDQQIEQTARISIHAPLAGCDHGTWRPTPFPANFNPRTPCGVRLHRPCRSSVKSRFQSTHPLRGATCPKQKPVTGQNISIHAPLAGCDRTQPDRR